MVMRDMLVRSENLLYDGRFWELAAAAGEALLRAKAVSRIITRGETKKFAAVQIFARLLPRDLLISWRIREDQRKEFLGARFQMLRTQLSDARRGSTELLAGNQRFASNQLTSVEHDLMI